MATPLVNASIGTDCVVVDERTAAVVQALDTDAAAARAAAMC